MKRKGLIGGTFDPVHRGHISLAVDAMEQAQLDEVIFMPAGHQPFKLDKRIAPAADRVAMLKIAAAGVPGLAVSELETSSDEVSYTYLTLDRVRKMLGPDYRLYFITGTDTFLKLQIWRRSEELLSMNSFIVGSRPGYREDELEKCIRAMKDIYGTETILINNRRLDISATEIRERAAAGESITEMVPEGVEEYIKEHGLYK